MKKELLTIENGSILNNGIKIMKSLYFNLFQGESLGFVFDNALEKNILVDFLKGKRPLESGRIAFENRSIPALEYETCFEHNISVIERTGKLIRSLSVEENVFLLSPHSPDYFVRNHAFEKPGKELEAKLGVCLWKYSSSGTLSEKDRVILEMVKAFAEEKKIIVFSNITSFLKEPDLEEVYSMVKKMRRWGMSFLVVEAFDEIIFRWTDQFAIIRHGKTMGLINSQNAQSDKVFEMLLGDDMEKRYPVPAVSDMDYEEWECQIEFDSVSTEVLNGLSFSAGRGEVLKIYYMDDASGNHILELLKGERKAKGGSVFLGGRPYSAAGIHQAIKKGVGFIEEFAYVNKVLCNLSVFENISLLLGEKVPMFWLRRRFRKNIRSFLETVFEPSDLDRKPEEIQPVELQRMCYYKWYLYNPKVVVCIRPFAQEDVHVREITVLMIEMLKKRGITVIILLSSFSELDLVDGENIFVHKGCLIDEDGVYQILYGGR